MSSQYHFADARKMAGSELGNSHRHANKNRRHAELVSASLKHYVLVNPAPPSCHAGLDPASRASAQASLLNTKGRESYVA